MRPAHFFSTPRTRLSTKTCRSGSEALTDGEHELTARLAPEPVELAAVFEAERAHGGVEAKAEALTGPTTLPGQRVQTLNPPGSEVGPNAVATWGTSKVDRADAYGFKWNRSGQSSKHIPFALSGPD